MTFGPEGPIWNFTGDAYQMFFYFLFWLGSQINTELASVLSGVVDT